MFVSCWTHGNDRQEDCSFFAWLLLICSGEETILFDGEMQLDRAGKSWLTSTNFMRGNLQQYNHWNKTISVPNNLYFSYPGVSPCLYLSTHVNIHLLCLVGISFNFRVLDLNVNNSSHEVNLSLCSEHPLPIFSKNVSTVSPPVSCINRDQKKTWPAC